MKSSALMAPELVRVSLCVFKMEGWSHSDCFSSSLIDASCKNAVSGSTFYCLGMVGSRADFNSFNGAIDDVPMSVLSWLWDSWCIDSPYAPVR